MGKIIDSLIHSCQKATELIEKNQLIGLSLAEEIQLKAHKMVCEACRNYEKQSKVLDQLMMQKYKSENQSQPTIPTDLKAAIKAKLLH